MLSSTTMTEAQANFYWSGATTEQLQEFVAAQVSLCPTPGDQRKTEAAKVLLRKAGKPIPRPGQDLTAPIQAPGQTPAQAPGQPGGQAAPAGQAPQGASPQAPSPQNNGVATPSLIDQVAHILIQIGHQVGPADQNAGALHHGLVALIKLAEFHLGGQLGNSGGAGTGAAGGSPAGTQPGSHPASTQPAPVPSKPLRVKPRGIQPFNQQSAGFFWSGASEEDMTDWVIRNADSTLSQFEERKFWAAMFLLGPKAPTADTAATPASTASAPTAASALPGSTPAASTSTPVTAPAAGSAAMPPQSPSAPSFWNVSLIGTNNRYICEPNNTPIEAGNPAGAVEGLLRILFPTGQFPLDFLTELSGVLLIETNDRGEVLGNDPVVLALTYADGVIDLHNGQNVSQITLPTVI